MKHWVYSFRSFFCFYVPIFSCVLYQIFVKNQEVFGHRGHRVHREATTYLADFFGFQWHTVVTLKKNKFPLSPVAGSFCLLGIRHFDELLAEEEWGRILSPLVTWRLYESFNFLTILQKISGPLMIFGSNPFFHPIPSFWKEPITILSSEILNFFLTPGNVHDCNEQVMNKLTKDLFGKLFGDKGYIGKKLFDKLFGEGIQLVTKIKKKMKNILMNLEDKILLRK